MSESELIAALESPNRQIRSNAIFYALDFGDETILQRIIELARTDSEVDVRDVAIRAMAWMHNKPEVLPQLLEFFESPEEPPIIRAEAAQAIGDHLELSDQRKRLFRRAVKSLLKGLVDDAPEVRFWAAFSLGKMRTRKALPSLRHVAATDEAVCPHWWLVRDEATDAIAIIEGRMEDIPER